MIRRKLSELNETLLDLVTGTILFDAVMGILGMIVTKGHLFYLLGIGAGMVEAVIFCFLMLYFIDGALDMEPKSANSYILKGTMIRYAVMLITGIIAIKLHIYCFVGVVLALLGIKVSAFMQPFVNLYITKKMIDDEEFSSVENPQS